MILNLKILKIFIACNEIQLWNNLDFQVVDRPSLSIITELAFGVGCNRILVVDSATFSPTVKLIIVILVFLKISTSVSSMLKKVLISSYYVTRPHIISCTQFKVSRRGGNEFYHPITSNKTSMPTVPSRGTVECIVS